jgi:hypothetical protein
MSTQPGADRIERAAFGFMASKVLFTAIECGLLTELVNGPSDAEHVGVIKRAFTGASPESGFLARLRMTTCLKFRGCAPAYRREVRQFREEESSQLLPT